MLDDHVRVDDAIAVSGSLPELPARRCAHFAHKDAASDCTKPLERDALLGLGVAADRIYVDHDLTGTNDEPPRLREALASPGAPMTSNDTPDLVLQELL